MNEIYEQYEQLCALKKEILVDETALRVKATAYKEKMREVFGITDGDTLDILSLIRLIDRVKELDTTTFFGGP